MKQALLRSVTPDGTVYQLVVLQDNRCAILRDDVCAFESSGDEAGIDDAVQRFTALTRALLTQPAEGSSEPAPTEPHPLPADAAAAAPGKSA